MQSRLEPHHVAWLSAHTYRDQDWLRRMLHAGFDVHHLDGNHSNNDPDNLVLIEHVDHLNLHGRKSGIGRLGSAKDPRGPQKAKTKAIEKALRGPPPDRLDMGIVISLIASELNFGS